uniref:Uncharacterized protein n=1 Tax=Neobodo designis TaxID=312471 RepID=A0A6U4XTE9_NEODS
MRRAVRSCCGRPVAYCSQSRGLSLTGWFRGVPHSSAGSDDAAAGVSAEINSLSAAQPTTASTIEQFARSVDSPEKKSLIQRMDDSWTAFFDGFGLPHFGFIDGGAAWLQVIEAMTGVGWPATIFAFGFAMRLLTLGLSVYGERATLRMVLATKETQAEHRAYDEVSRTFGASQLEIREAGEKMKAARDAACRRHGTSMLAVMSPLLGAPVFAGGLAVVFRLLETMPRGIESSGLGVPEPTGVAACVAVGATLMNFELTLARKRAGSSQQNAMSLVPFAARCVAVGALGVVAQLKAGLVIYWCGMCCAGLLQPLVMSLPAFRHWLKIPDVGPVVQPNPLRQGVASDASAPTGGTGGILMSRFPTLAKLLQPGAALRTMEDLRTSEENNRAKETPKRATSWRGNTK